MYIIVSHPFTIRICFYFRLVCTRYKYMWVHIISEFVSSFYFIFWCSASQISWCMSCIYYRMILPKESLRIQTDSNEINSCALCKCCSMFILQHESGQIALKDLRCTVCVLKIEWKLNIYIYIYQRLGQRGARWAYSFFTGPFDTEKYHQFSIKRLLKWEEWPQKTKVYLKNAKVR